MEGIWHISLGSACSSWAANLAAIYQDLLHETTRNSCERIAVQLPKAILDLEIFDMDYITSHHPLLQYY